MVPTVVRLAELAQLFGCELADFLRETSNRPTEQGIVLSQQLARLDDADRTLLLETVERLVERLARQLIIHHSLGGYGFPFPNLLVSGLLLGCGLCDAMVAWLCGALREVAASAPAFPFAVVAVGFGIELLQQHRHLFIDILKLAIAQQVAAACSIWSMASPAS